MRPTRTWRAIVAAACTCLLFTTAAFAQSAAVSTADYDYYAVGALDSSGVAIDVEVARPAAQAIVLEGGDTDVRDAFAWMVERAGGGNFLVLRASGADGYNDWIQRQVGGTSSVETIVTKTAAAASDPFVLDRIAHADAIFFAGGDQWDYVRDWQGTKLARAVQEAVAQRRVPVGGTSAGMMILGEIVFSARFGSISSAEALANIDNPALALVRDVVDLPALAYTVTDSHIVKRDRMGRLVAFMARSILDRLTTLGAARAIGVEAKTALLIEGGVARVEGPGAVYFLRPLGAAPLRCSAGNPSLVFRNVEVQRLDGKNQRFDLASWQAASSFALTTYDVSAECGVMLSSQGGNKLY